MPDRSSIRTGGLTGAAAARTVGPAPGGTVLIVDLDAGARAEMTAWLRRAGYATAEAEAFEEARQALAARSFDVLVVAVRLGAFNGLHLVITARAAQPALRAVLTTSADDRALASEARQVDAACLVKPIVCDALLAAVAQGHQET
jgi:DNA-binding NtrC family response regulator